jgi:biotin carboxyl carrier protein
VQPARKIVEATSREISADGPVPSRREPATVWMKKRYVLRNDDQQHDAVVARDDGRVEVQIDEQGPRPVDAAIVLGGHALSLRIDGRMYLVHLTGSDLKGGVRATLCGRPLSLTVLDELHALALESLGSVAGSGTVTTDIPGLVVEVKVRVGQRVHQGEPVIVVEAMKMQNELIAAVSGTVTETPVAAGQTVNPGDPLVLIEPEPGG